MARTRKSGDAEPARERKSLEALPLPNASHWDEVELSLARVSIAARTPLPTYDTRAEVAAELTRMAAHGAGGACVMYRRPPAVTRAVHDEIRRLLLAVPGAREVTGLPAYSFDREATDVIAEVLKGLEQEGSGR